MPEVISAWETGPETFSFIERDESGGRKVRRARSLFTLFLDSEKAGWVGTMRAIDEAGKNFNVSRQTERFVRFDAAPRKGRSRTWSRKLRDQLRGARAVERGLPRG